jgi:PAS domain S-box-containing protein
MTGNKAGIQSDPELFRDLINKSNDAIFVVDPPTGLFIFVNDKACAALGYDSRELLGMGVTDIETSFPHDFSWQIHVNELRQKGSLIFEGMHKRRNGTAFPVEANISYVTLDTREYLVTIVRDITERKRAEREISERGALVRQIMDTASVGINLVDKRGRITHANRCMAEMFGCTVEELVGSEYIEHVHPFEREAGRRSMLSLLASSIPSVDLERRYVRKDGTEFLGHLSGRRFHDAQGKELGLIGVITDITERKRAEEALAESEANYRRLFDSSTDGIFILDLDGNFIDANRTAYERLGYKREEILAMNISEMDHPSFSSRVPERLRQIREHGVVVFESGHLRKNGSLMPVEVNSRLLEYGGKQVFFSVVRDISERKRAEEALHLSRFTVDNVADAVYWMDSKARIVDVNETACSMLGYTREELLNLTVFDIDPDFTEDRWAGEWEALKAEGKRTVETRHRAKDGRIIPVEIMANYLSFAGKEIDCAFARDITQRKLEEENMLKTQKLESLGILAGGIAHDFNNILTAILGNISLARMNIRPDEPGYERLEEAERASYQARELTRQLLTFAKGGAPVKNTLSAEQLIRDYVGFAVRGSNVRCDFGFGEGLWPVDVDEGQMGQVFNNLVINACQAMPGGGTIKIDARNVDVGPKNGMPLPEGKYVRISVEDRGTGISGEHLQRIFDPYFTTKQDGSGLGLSIVYSVIRNHNGRITVKSDPGVGTVFTMYLPASQEKIVEKNLKGEGCIPGRGRVLLMDDEEIVRRVSGEILKAMGYEVEFASDGAEAIRLYKTAMASSNPFDAVIMDLTVPGGMGGKEAIGKLHEVDPDVKAIVSSGYSQDPIMANYREYGFCEVIAKPFSSIELGRIMHEVIVKS